MQPEPRRDLAGVSWGRYTQRLVIFLHLPHLLCASRISRGNRAGTSPPNRPEEKRGTSPGDGEAALLLRSWCGPKTQPRAQPAARSIGASQGRSGGERP